MSTLCGPGDMHAKTSYWLLGQRGCGWKALSDSLLGRELVA